MDTELSPSPEGVFNRFPSQFKWQEWCLQVFTASWGSVWRMFTGPQFIFISCQDVGSVSFTYLFHSAVSCGLLSTIIYNTNWHFLQQHQRIQLYSRKREEQFAEWGKRRIWLGEETHLAFARLSAVPFRWCFLPNVSSTPSTALSALGRGFWWERRQTRQIEERVRELSDLFVFSLVH